MRCAETAGEEGIEATAAAIEAPLEAETVGAAKVEATLIINLDSLAVVKRLNMRNAAVAYDNLTETLITGAKEDVSLATRTRVQAYNSNFDPIAEYLLLYGPGWFQARNGILAVSPNSLDFTLLRVPSLEVISSRSLPL